MLYSAAPFISKFQSMRCRLALIGFMLVAGCGTVVDHHEVTLIVEGLDGPVEAAIVEHTSSEALRDSVKLAPAPIRREVTGTRVVAGLSHSEAAAVSFGFVIPRLSPDGYFFVNLAPEEDKEKGEVAELVRWGQFFPEQGAMTVPVTYSGTATREGWELKVVVEARR